MNSDTLDLRQLARMIDYAHLKTSKIPRSLEKHCEEAARYGFVMVAIHPCDVETCARYLEGSQVHVGAVVGFPLGHNTLSTKDFETRDAISRGADEIDLMINLRALLSGNHKLVYQEIETIVRICKEHQVISKIILETCYLDEDQKILVCQMALKAGADFVKTSTGFGPAGATTGDVKIMRAVVGDKIGVKAAGGIRDLKTTLAMIAAGATRIGTSYGVQIIEELKDRIARDADSG